jgi:nicotinamide-nucleotide adenylyltransferase
MFPGRFQPFHRGHRQFVERMAETVDEVVIAIGSAQASHTGRNPFTAGERVAMVHRATEPMAIPTYAVPVEDLDRHRVWPAHVQSLCPPFEVVFSNNPRVARVCSEAGLEVRGVEPIERGRYRGTEIRRRMVDGERWSHLVPDAVAAEVDAIDGVDRLRRVVAHPEHAVG